MQSAHNIQFRLVTVACTPEILRESQERFEAAREVAGCEILLLKGYRPSIPGSVDLNAKLVRRALDDSLMSFDFIHARTDYSAAVAAALAPHGRPRIIWDCRGDSAAEIRDAAGPDMPSWRRWLGPVRTAAAARHRRAAVTRADGAIFVSEALRLSHGADLRPGAEVLVAPNCADETLFFFSPALRAKTRTELGIAEDERLYVYSGGLSPYQRLDDTVRLFAAIAERDARSRLLLLTPAPERVRELVARLAPPLSPIIRSAAHAAVNAYLNAADAAFMLRHRTATNRAASPTKFAEYCLAGLPILMSDAVPGAYEYAQRFGNFVAEDDADPGRRIAGIDRESVAADAKSSLGRLANARSFDAFYRNVVGGEATV